MAEAVANGIRFNYQRLTPDGSDSKVDSKGTVVCIHSPVWDNLTSYYFTVASLFVASGYDLLLYDLRGHGRTQTTPDGYTLEEGADDLDALLDAVGIVDPAFLVGNSYGGLLAARMALDHPHRVAGLYLVEGHGGRRQPMWTESVLNVLTLIATTMEHRSAGPPPSGAAARRAGKMTADVNRLLNETSYIEDLAGSKLVPEEDLPAIKCPVLAAYGTASVLYPAHADLAELVPECTVAEFPGLTHPLLFDDPKGVHDAFVRWHGELAP